MFFSPACLALYYCWMATSSLSLVMTIRRSFVLLSSKEAAVAAVVLACSTTLDAKEEQARWFRLEIQALLQRQGKDYDAADSADLSGKSLAGPLLRLAFHDAATFEPSKTLFWRWFDGISGVSNSRGTGGPNGSIPWELDRAENRGLDRPLQVVQDILSKQQRQEQQQQRQQRTSFWDRDIDTPLSLADAICLSGAAAVQAAGGPYIPVRLGRRDVEQEADAEFLKRPWQGPTLKSKVYKTLPVPSLDANGIRLYFSRWGLTDAEIVALSGCHGMGRHFAYSKATTTTNDRRGPDSTTFASRGKDKVPRSSSSALLLVPFVAASVDRFDNTYFQTLLKWYHANGQERAQLGRDQVATFLGTDIALVMDPSLRQHVQAFADDQEEYFNVFVRAYQKLTDPKATITNRRY